MIGVIGVILSLILLIILVFKRWGNIPAAIVAALLAIVTNYGLTADVFRIFRYTFLGTPSTDNGITGLLGFISSYFFLLVFGALFGHVLDQTGAAKSIAQFIAKKVGSGNAILVTMLLTSILCYAGVAAFVAMFAVYPIAIHLIKDAKLPRKYLCGAYYAGLTAINTLPGSSHLYNTIPTDFLGTNIFSAPLLGIYSFIGKFLLAYLYLTWSSRRAMSKGEVFQINEAVDGPQLKKGLENSEKECNVGLAVISPILTVGLSLIFTKTIVAAKVISANDSVGLALLISSLYALIVFRQNVDTDPIKIITQGIQKGFGPLFLTGAVVGYGSVIAATPAYNSFLNFATSLDLNPYFSAIIAVNVICGITGSGSGGLRIFMQTAAERFVATGVNPAAFHRICAMAAGGLDSLPHNGTIITTQEVMGSNYKESYWTLFVVSVIIPLIVVCVGAVIAMILY
ncbi:MAG: hypothetical protein LIO81_08660 [Clostridiales bacterium]|nr:hypothetical protein [Clostridiales bacterium]